MTRHVSASIADFKNLAGRFEHVHIDLVTTQYSQGFRLLLDVHRPFFAVVRSHSHSEYGGINGRCGVNQIGVRRIGIAANSSHMWSKTRRPTITNYL
ncbi:hypothetical protein WN48_09806 [Eufriesea mexicana]|uniref:Uncharacterized protein n=1 Tax=Eufriesea mexicana TaxID=516756 RepID=A0A310S659_9HYME|nr:hypothetical protein WN48_09806 [Eufriesea mexicana]